MRHLVYLRPGTVVLIDELAARNPSTYELWFHADGQPGRTPDRLFRSVAERAWESATPTGRCRITALNPADAVAEAGTQPIIGTGGHPGFDLEVLRLRNARPVRSALFVTVVDVWAGAQDRPLPELRTQGGRLRLKVHVGRKVWTCRVSPGQRDPAHPILRDIRWSTTAPRAGKRACRNHDS